MSDPIIEALRAKLKSGEAKPKRGILRLWMRKNHATIRNLLAEGLSWHDLAATLKDRGLRNDRGEEITVRRAQQTWYMVRKEVEARASGKPEHEVATSPTTLADANPAIPVSPRPSRKLDPTKPRQEYREDDGDGFGLSSGPLPPRAQEDEG